MWKRSDPVQPRGVSASARLSESGVLAGEEGLCRHGQNPSPRTQGASSPSTSHALRPRPAHASRVHPPPVTRGRAALCPERQPTAPPHPRAMKGFRVAPPRPQPPSRCLWTSEEPGGTRRAHGQPAVDSATERPTQPTRRSKPASLGRLFQGLKIPNSGRQAVF